jgi:hypothetical protein
MFGQSRPFRALLNSRSPASKRRVSFGDVAEALREVMVSRQGTGVQKETERQRGLH